MPYARFKQILAVTLIVLLTGGIILFWVNSSIVEQATVLATQQKMIVLARAGTKSLESLLSLFKSELVILADREEIKNFDLPVARESMTKVILTANHPIVHQLGLISKEGVLLITTNIEGKRENEGNSLADRKFFQWAKTAKEGEVFLSEPIVGRSGMNKGKWVVVLATPITRADGSFNGVLYAPIRIEDLTVQYVDTLKITPNARVFVLNEEGIIVSSPFADLIGVNVREYAQEKKWKEYETTLRLIERMTKGEEGAQVYWFMGTDGKIIKTIAGFVPIRFDASMISLGVAIPYNEAYNLVSDFFRNQIIWLVFLILVGVTAGFFLIAGIHLSGQHGYNLGLKDGANFERNGRGKKSA